MTKRKKKILTIQILLFSLATILIFFTYYGKNDNKFDNKKTKTETKPINMKIMSAIFYLKDGSILKIKGDWGSYNNQTYDMKFRENIETKYKDNFIYSEKLDYLNSKQLLTVSGNVKTKSLQGNIEADRLLFDLSLNTLDISMFDENQVKVKMKNK